MGAKIANLRLILQNLDGWLCASITKSGKVGCALTALANSQPNSKPIEIKHLLGQANEDASTKSRWLPESRQDPDRVVSLSLVVAF